MLQERSCPILRRGDAAWGHACGRPPGGGTPLGGRREGGLHHGVPGGGGGGPKKRHLVLYKLAGFRHTDKAPWSPFFRGAMHNTKNGQNPFLTLFSCFFGGGPPVKPYLNPKNDHFWPPTRTGGTPHFWPKMTPPGTPPGGGVPPRDSPPGVLNLGICPKSHRILYLVL